MIKASNIFNKKKEAFRQEHQGLKAMLTGEMTNVQLFPLYDKLKRALRVRNDLRRREQIPSSE